MGIECKRFPVRFRSRKHATQKRRRRGPAQSNARYPEEAQPGHFVKVAQVQSVLGSSSTLTDTQRELRGQESPVQESIPAQAKARGCNFRARIAQYSTYACHYSDLAELMSAKVTETVNDVVTNANVREVSQVSIEIKSNQNFADREALLHRDF